MTSNECSTIIYPIIKIINNKSDIIFNDINIQSIVIESPIRSKDIVEDINIKQEMDKITKLPDLPESLLEDIRRLGYIIINFILLLERIFMSLNYDSLMLLK